MVAVQTQCCLTKRDEEWEDDDGESAQEGTAVQLVEPVPSQRCLCGPFWTTGLCCLFLAMLPIFGYVGHFCLCCPKFGQHNHVVQILDNINKQ